MDCRPFRIKRAGVGDVTARCNNAVHDGGRCTAMSTSTTFFSSSSLSVRRVDAHLPRYALEYLTTHWERLQDFSEAFSGVDLEKMRRAVEPSLVAEGQ